MHRMDLVSMPRASIAVSALAMVFVASTPEVRAADAGADDGGADATTAADAAAADSAAGADSTGEDAMTLDAPALDGCLSSSSPGAGPGPSQIPGPPSNDGALDDGYMPPFTLNHGDALGYLGICRTLPTPFAYNAVKAPYADAAGCQAFDPQGHPNSHNCQCQKCFGLVQQCDALPGCRAIVKCALDSGCNGSLACYLLPGAPCVAPINNAGTGSVSTALSQTLQACGQSNQCPAQ